MDRFNEEIKEEYDQLCSGRENPDYHAQVLDYWLAAVLRIWGSNELYAPEYAELVSEVTGKPVSMEQIITGMACCSDPKRKLEIPAFLRALAEEDRKNGTSLTKEQMEKINGVLVSSAMVNGDFTMEEASAVSSIMKDWIRFASEAGVDAPELPEYRSRITPKKETGYYMGPDPDADRGKSPERKREEDADGEDADGKLSIPIRLNITISTEENESAGGSSCNCGKGKELKLETAEEPRIQKTEETGETMESLLEELDGLVGLEEVKQDVHSLLNFIRVSQLRRQRGMKVPTISYHLVFTGNPGTGKTTVARLVGKLYYHMGILPQGQLVEADRSALVAGYLGQTAIKTQKVIQQAMGGVLFIDEAYSLAEDDRDSYGKEAVETILKAMEDHRDELVVIVAGYTELMHQFIDSNPGLSSRFNKYFEFPDYTGEELLAIYRRFCEKNGYVLSEEAAGLLKTHFDSLYETRDDRFGNARTARNLFEKAIHAQADRIAFRTDLSNEDLERILPEDILAAAGGIG